MNFCEVIEKLFSFDEIFTTRLYHQLFIICISFQGKCFKEEILLKVLKIKGRMIETPILSSQITCKIS